MASFLSSNDVPTDAEKLLEECEDGIHLAEEISEKIAPDSEPYKHKYEARDTLDSLHRKLEAFHVLLTVQAKDTAIYASLSRRIKAKTTSVDVRLGAIAYDVEEPHVSEKDLEAAGQYLFKDFYDISIKSCRDLHTESEVETTTPDEKYDPVTWQPPPLDLSVSMSEYGLDIYTYVIDSVKCLNMLGILWSSRGRLKGSILFLLGAKSIYASYKKDKAAKRLSELESLHTLTCFYLAQVFGHLHEMKLSCIYCQETLRRQYSGGFGKAPSSFAYEWAKNCANISDFYASLQCYRRCYLSLAAAKMILDLFVIGDGQAVVGSILEEEAKELDADIHRRHGRLCENILRKCFERESALQSLAAEMNMDSTAVRSSTEAKEIFAIFSKCESAEDIFEQDMADHTTGITDIPITTTDPSVSRLCIPQLPQILRVSDIVDFETAKQVFLRGATHIEAAKKFYLLDGYVTDHMTLLQSQSKLYHYLSAFEKDMKRLIAMQSRRIELLQPVISMISKTAFEALHKQLSYELGETYISLLDAKLDKFRNRSSSSGVVDISQLKGSEIEKCNSYIRGALAMFAHFTLMYSTHTSDDKVPSPSLDWPLQRLISVACENPKLDDLNDDEVRPYLNAHFLTARMISKILITKQGPFPPYIPLEACLKKYQWIIQFVKELCSSKGIAAESIPFHDEMKICEEMVQLLPGKIHRMRTTGESGLNL